MPRKRSRRGSDSCRVEGESASSSPSSDKSCKSLQNQIPMAVVLLIVEYATKCDIQLVTVVGKCFNIQLNLLKSFWVNLQVKRVTKQIDCICQELRKCGLEYENYYTGVEVDEDNWHDYLNNMIELLVGLWMEGFDDNWDQMFTDLKKSDLLLKDKEFLVSLARGMDIYHDENDFDDDEYEYDFDDFFRSFRRKLCNDLSEELRNDGQFIIDFLKRIGEECLEKASKSLKNDESFVLRAVTINGCYLEYFSDEMKNNCKVVMAAVKTNGNALEYVSDEMKNNCKVVMAAVKELGCALKYASDEMKDNCKVVMVAVKESGWALEYASDEMKDNLEIVMAAVKTNGRALEYVSDEIQDNLEIVMAAVKKSGYALKYASDEMKNNFEVVVAAVKNDGHALEYASDEMKNNLEIFMAAKKELGLL